MKTIITRRNQNLANNLVFIDGFSSSGKSLICPLFGFLERVENWQLDYFYEHISISHYFDGIKDSSAETLLKLKSDELIYNLFLSRNVNFRKSDQTSPFYFGNHKKYTQRLKKEEGDQVTDEIIKNKPILPLHLHYIYGHSDIIFKSLIDRIVIYLVMVRDPCYLIEKWHQNNWVDRIGSDHRDFHICFNLNNYNLPWFAKDFCYEYIQSNSIERSILTIYHIFSKIIQKPECSKKEYNDKTLFVFFEDFVKEPEVYINLICKKLNTRRSKEFEGLLKKLSLPRKKVPNELSLKEFTQKYKNEISKDILMKLDHLYNIYEDFYNKYKVI